MFRQLVTEALDKNNTIARNIIKKMNVGDYKNIAEMEEANYSFIKNICSNLSQRFDEADEEEQKDIMEKIYNKLHSSKSTIQEEEPALDQGIIAQRIREYIAQHNGVLFPAEEKSEELANFIVGEKQEQEAKESIIEKKDEKKSDFKKTLRKDLLKSIPALASLLAGASGFGTSKVVDHYLSAKKENSLSEAKMSDIPHEIDDQIHKLKDMRFDIEETEKNWELAGMDTRPMFKIRDAINDLIETMYHNGAELADQEIDKSISDNENKESEESSIEEKDNL